MFDVNVIGDYSHRNDHCCVAIDYYNGQGATVGGKFEPGPAAIINSVFPGSIPNPVSPQNFTAYLNRTLTEAVIDEGVSAQANWTTPWFNNAKLTSITAYRKNSDKYGGDTDDTLADIVNSTPNTNYHPVQAVLGGAAVRGHTAPASTGRSAASCRTRC